MSDLAKETFMLVELKRVRMFSVDGRVIRLVTEKDGARDFEFDCEEAAHEALGEWLAKNGDGAA
jgi:hypothetical protein